jgi:hypothetical protein
MKHFFNRNLAPGGRIARAILGVALILAGLLLSAPGRWICTALVIGGGFCLFEAARGWCVMRACGIKTRL